MYKRGDGCHPFGAGSATISSASAVAFRMQSGTEMPPRKLPARRRPGRSARSPAPVRRSGRGPARTGGSPAASGGRGGRRARRAASRGRAAPPIIVVAIRSSSQPASSGSVRPPPKAASATCPSGARPGKSSEGKRQPSSAEPLLARRQESEAVQGVADVLPAPAERDHGDRRRRGSRRARDWRLKWPLRGDGRRRRPARRAPPGPPRPVRRRSRRGNRSRCGGPAGRRRRCGRRRSPAPACGAALRALPGRRSWRRRGTAPCGGPSRRGSGCRAPAPGHGSSAPPSAPTAAPDRRRRRRRRTDRRVVEELGAEAAADELRDALLGPFGRPADPGLAQQPELGAGGEERSA